MTENKTKQKKIETTEKLQKVLARFGLGSRREIEQWIESGRVSVNGKKAKLGDRVLETDKIKVDDSIVSVNSAKKDKTRVIIYHKPIGEICTRHDTENRKTVFDQLPQLNHGRWVAIGRLDINTSGLLLFTNDGELANKLMHPSSEIEREYAVRVYGVISQNQINQLLKGVLLEDGLAKFEKITLMRTLGANTWYNVVLKEGRNREVKRLFQAQHLTVNRLIRIRFGTIKLTKDVYLGRWTDIDTAAINTLKKLL